MKKSNRKRRIKIDPFLLEISDKIDRSTWSLGDWDIKLNPTKGYSVFNYKTGSGNTAKFYQENYD